MKTCIITKWCQDGSWDSEPGGTGSEPGGSGSESEYRFRARGTSLEPGVPVQSLGVPVQSRLGTVSEPRVPV